MNSHFVLPCCRLMINIFLLSDFCDAFLFSDAPSKKINGFHNLTFNTRLSVTKNCKEVGILWFKDCVKSLLDKRSYSFWCEFNLICSITWYKHYSTAAN